MSVGLDFVVWLSSNGLTGNESAPSDEAVRMVLTPGTRWHDEFRLEFGDTEGDLVIRHGSETLLRGDGAGILAQMIEAILDSSTLLTQGHLAGVHYGTDNHAIILEPQGQTVLVSEIVYGGQYSAEFFDPGHQFRMPPDRTPGFMVYRYPLPLQEWVQSALGLAARFVQLVEAAGIDRLSEPDAASFEAFNAKYRNAAKQAPAPPTQHPTS